MNGRKGMLAVFGAFLAPVLLAAIVYQMGWFNAGVTNKGEFMQHEITLNWILPDNATDSEWIILYHIPANCEQTCENVLYSLNQGYQALGKLQGKAHPVAVRTADSTISTDKLKSQFPYVQIIEQQANQQQTISQLSSDHIY